MGIGTGLLIGGATAAMDTGLGMLGGAVNDKRSRKNMRYANQMNKELWDYTNAENQVKHLENAGLNVGLMYKGGGATGSTGSMNGSTAPVEVGKMNGQSALLESQVELNKSQAEKNVVEANKIRGVDTDNTSANTENIYANTGLTKIKTELEKVGLEVAGKTKEHAIEQIAIKTETMIAEAIQKGNEASVSSQTIDDEVLQIKSEAIGVGIKNLLMKSEIKVNDKQMEEIQARINKMSQDIRQGDEKLAVERFKAEMGAKYPTVMQAGGRVLDETINSILNITGLRERNNKETRSVEGNERINK